MFKVNDKVRTNSKWNDNHEPFEGIVQEVKLLEISNSEIDSNGFIHLTSGSYSLINLIIEGQKGTFHPAYFDLIE